MATVTKVPPIPPPPNFVIELTSEEAKALFTLLGHGINCGPLTDLGLRDLYQALCKAEAGTFNFIFTDRAKGHIP